MESQEQAWVGESLAPVLALVRLVPLLPPVQMMAPLSLWLEPALVCLLEVEC